jgi:hypothetical protein
MSIPFGHFIVCLSGIYSCELLLWPLVSSYFPYISHRGKGKPGSICGKYYKSNINNLFICAIYNQSAIT